MHRGITALVVGLGFLVTPSLASAQTPAPCQIGEGAGFSDLSGRLVVGSDDIFDVQVEGEGEPIGRYRVTMVDDHRRTFFSGKVEDSTSLFLRLDWPDRYADVSASGVVEDLDGNRCQFVITKRVRAIRHVYFPSRCSNTSYRPRSVVVACGDGNFQLRKMRWRGWNRKTVRGSGLALYNDCDPYCAAGRFHRTPVRVRLSGRKRCAGPGLYVYTKLKYRIRRSGRTEVQSSPFPCGAYDLG